MTYIVDPIKLADVRPGDHLLIAGRNTEVSRVVETERPTRTVAGPPLIKQCVRLYDVEGDAFVEAPLDETVHRVTSPLGVVLPATLLIDLQEAFRAYPDDAAARDELVVDAANAIVHHLTKDQEATR